MKAAVISLLTAALALPGFCQSPAINRVQPAAVASGKSTELAFYGERLPGAVLWSSFAIKTVPVPGTTNSDEVVFRLEVPPRTPMGIGAVCLVTTNGVSGWHFLMVDDLPSIRAFGTNHSIATAQELKLPVAIDGAAESLKSDFYTFTAKKGQRLSVEIVAQRLGSPMDPWMRLLDGSGRELVSVEDTPGAGADGRFEHRFAAGGVYFLEIRDTSYGGSPKHRYRLRVGDFPLAPLPFLADVEMFPPIEFGSPVARLSEREPNDTPEGAFRVEIPSEIAGRLDRAGDRDYYEFNVGKGQRLVFRGRTRSLGSPCDLFLQVQDAAGAKVAEANFSAGDDGILTNTFAKAGTYRLLLEELNRLGGPDLNYRLSIETLTPGFSLSVETDRVSAPPGSEFEILVSTVRRDYDGPIRLSVAGLGPDFTVTNAVIRGKTNEVKLTVSVPDEAELGQFFPFAILGQAEIGGQTNQVRASTMPALRRQFPEMLWPPEELDGWLALGVATTKSEAAPKPKRKRK